jgi:hypothetical protein
MAVAGLVGESVGYGPAFIVAGSVPLVTAIIVLLVARFPRDELAHPLAAEPPSVPAPADAV